MATGTARIFFAALGLATFVVAGATAGEPVQIKPSLLRLNANLELPEGKTEADGVAILLHGTLSHHRQETIAALQQNLKARGVGTLAITLSLGIDDRQGPRACDVLHDYALAGVRRELILWLAWLGGHGAKSIDLIGFSRGGAEIASVVRDLAPVRKIVLVAPAFSTSDELAMAYQRSFGHPLGPLLEAARTNPLQRSTVDFLLCRQAPVLGATFLDGYRELPTRLAAETGRPTLVVVAGKDEIVRDLGTRLPVEVPRVTIDGAGHFFPDLYGEDAADAIAKFLKE